MPPWIFNPLYPLYVLYCIRFKWWFVTGGAVPGAAAAAGPFDYVMKPKKKPARFLPNPTDNWGPKARATGGRKRYVRACMRTRMYVRACMCACIHMCVHVCLHVCLHVCVHVCMHVCLHMYAPYS